MDVISKPDQAVKAGSGSSKGTKRSARASAKASSSEDIAEELHQRHKLEKKLEIARQREVLRAHIDKHGIVRVPIGSRELPPLGGMAHYAWQFYLRASLLIPEHLHFVANAFWSVYAARYRERPFQIAGVEAAAVPIITTLLIHAAPRDFSLRGFTIRKERKKYGLENLIEGDPDPTLPVVLIDDLTSTEHLAIWHAVRALRDRQLTLYPTCFVVVFKGRADTPRVLKTSLGPCTIEFLFKLEDFTLGFDEWHAKAVENSNQA